MQARRPHLCRGSAWAAFICAGALGLGQAAPGQAAGGLGAQAVLPLAVGGVCVCLRRGHAWGGDVPELCLVTADGNPSLHSAMRGLRG